MAEIEAASIVNGGVVLNDLIFTKQDGTTINAGNVRGPAGAAGATGAAGETGASPEGDLLQPGVVAAGHCALVRDLSSQVTIAAGVVWMLNTSGLFVRALPVSTVLEAIPTAVNKRLDQVVVASNGVISRLQGTTDDTTNTLTNRGGAVVVPVGSRLLHDLLVDVNGVTAINTRDRRSWARGAYNRITRTLNAAGNSDYSLPGSTPAVVIDGVNLAMRMECSGVPLRVTLRGSFTLTANINVGLTTFIDGLVPSGAVGITSEYYTHFPSVGFSLGFNYSYDFLPAPGSRLIKAAYMSNGTWIMYARNAMPITFTVEEIVRQNANNGMA